MTLMWKLLHSFWKAGYGLLFGMIAGFTITWIWNKTNHQKLFLYSPGPAPGPAVLILIILIQLYHQLQVHARLRSHELMCSQLVNTCLTFSPLRSEYSTNGESSETLVTHVSCYGDLGGWLSQSHPLRKILNVLFPFSTANSWTIFIQPHLQCGIAMRNQVHPLLQQISNFSESASLDKWAYNICTTSRTAFWWKQYLLNCSWISYFLRMGFALAAESLSASDSTLITHNLLCLNDLSSII